MFANIILGQEAHFMKGIDPVADAFAGTVRTDVYNMKNFHAMMFLLYRGASTSGTGTAVITVNACDDTTPSNRTAIPFRYRTCATGDTWSALTAATTSGFTWALSASGSAMAAVFVDAKDIEGTAPGYEYVELTSTEGTNDPYVGAIIAIGWPPRFSRAIQATALT